MSYHGFVVHLATLQSKDLPDNHLGRQDVPLLLRRLVCPQLPKHLDFPLQLNEPNRRRIISSKHFKEFVKSRAFPVHG